MPFSLLWQGVWNEIFCGHMLILDANRLVRFPNWLESEWQVGWGTWLPPVHLTSNSSLKHSPNYEHNFASVHPIFHPSIREQGTFWGTLCSLHTLSSRWDITWGMSYDVCSHTSVSSNCVNRQLAICCLCIGFVQWTHKYMRTQPLYRVNKVCVSCTVLKLLLSLISMIELWQGLFSGNSCSAG